MKTCEKFCRVSCGILMAVLLLTPSAYALTRIGVITDTHIGAPGAAARLEQTYRLLKSHGVTNIFNLGDIADRHVDAWYKQYVDIRARVYPEGVDEVFVYHNHDKMGFHSKETDRDKFLEEAFAAVQRKLGAKNGRYHSFKLEGFTFLAYPLGADYKRMEAEIQASVAADPGKPVFVLDHVPPLATSAGSYNPFGANATTAAIFRKYPQIVALTGHVHGSVTHEGKIWQREFTAVGFGTTKNAVAKDADYHIAIMELDSQKAVIRRYSLATGKEFRADDPWTLTFPFDPHHPRYSREVRAKTTPQPAFADGARPEVHPDHDHLGGLVVSFPGARNADWTSHYALSVEDADHDHAHPRSVVRAGGGLYAVPDEKRPTHITATLDPGLFTPGEKVTVAVTPQGFFGNEGKPISADAQVANESERGWTTVFKGLPGGAKKGVFMHPRSFTFPDEVWNAPAGTPYRFIFELAVRQPGVACMLEIANADRQQFIGKNLLEEGNWTRRFSFTVKRPKGDGPWTLNVYGGANRIQFKSFEIKRKDAPPMSGPIPDLSIRTAPNGNRYAEGLLRGKDGVGLYTYASLPKAGVKRPVVIFRNPYIRTADNVEDTNRVSMARLSGGASGIITLCQHCRGRGASEGDFRPYVDEREDGLALLAWLRQQDFFDGRIFLSGGSYLSTVHFAYLDTNPQDVVGAALKIQTPDWYRPNFRNGLYKTGLHGGWYKSNAHKKDRSLLRDGRVRFEDFPLVDWSRRYYGKPDRGFDEYLLHPREDDPYWSASSPEPFAGGYAKCALTNSTMPVMLRSGFYDIYTEDVFDQWRGMSPARRANCTLIVDAHDHGGKPQKWMKGTKAEFPGGERAHYAKAEDEFRTWCLAPDRAPSFTGFKLGHVSYYALWENAWHTEPTLADGPRTVTFTLNAATNAAEVAWTYDPKRTLPRFPGSGGICFGGMQLQPQPNFRDDVRSFLLPIRARLDVRGRMTATLAVKSDCEDTCFYVRTSVNKGDGKWYLLRDDIKPLTYDDGAYTPGTVRNLRFRFADHAFRLEPGDTLRVDVASAASGFQPHPNVAGNPSLARTPKIAHNAMRPADSTLVIHCLAD